MEKKIIFENDKNIDIMPINNNFSCKNSKIEGSGSESSLKEISSQPKDIEISSISSLNAVGKSNNSSNFSDEKIKIEHNFSFLNNNTNVFNNINQREDMIGLKLSSINNIDLGTSKVEISDLINELNRGNENNNMNNILDLDISNYDSNENIRSNIMDDRIDKKMAKIFKIILK